MGPGAAAIRRGGTDRCPGDALGVAVEEVRTPVTVVAAIPPSLQKPPIIGGLATGTGG